MYTKEIINKQINKHIRKKELTFNAISYYVLGRKQQLSFIEIACLISTFSLVVYIPIVLGIMTLYT